MRGFQLYIAFLLLVLGSGQSQLSAQQMLQDKINIEQINGIVESLPSWRMQKLHEWRGYVDRLPSAEKQKVIVSAERVQDFDWPSLFATQYMEYKFNGNRTNYEQTVNKRRDVLSRLVLGELVENKGRFIPQIVNGLWLTLEESTWVSPAHIVVQKSGAGLADPLDSYIDLGAGRTAADLSAIYLLLKDELDEYSPQVSKKIVKELADKILTPYAERDDFWWMNLREGTLVNNWNIWVNTNVLKTALLVDTDDVRLRKVLQKLMVSADKFIDFYPEDGACEEGPSYWGHAAGELGQMIQWLEDASGQRVSFKENNKIHQMGNYILHAHITGNRFLNFADAEAIQVPYPAKIWTYGTLYDDASLKAFAAYLDGIKGETLSLGSVQDFLMTAGVYHDLRKTDGTALRKNTAHYYESLQMATLRSNHAKGDLFFAAIGGTNGVSHNHNDVGSFMLYLDSLPVLIDVGVGTYTKETFGPNRYALWNMQSQWHNLPIINGIQQKDGKAFAAQDVKFEQKGNTYTYSIDISQAYPKEARVKQWNREFIFSPTVNRLLIAEDYVLEEWIQPSEIMLMTPVKPIVEHSSISLILANGKLVKIGFDSKVVEPSVEAKSIEDIRIAKIWGDQVFRIKLSVKGNKLKQSVPYTVEVVNQ